MSIKDSIDTISPLLHIAALRGHTNCLQELLLHTSSCLTDAFERLPSQVWHLQGDIPEELVQWETKNCLTAVSGDIHTIHQVYR